MNPDFPAAGARSLVRALGLALVAAQAGASLASASQLQLTLDADEAVWNQPHGFSVTGLGCDAHLLPPVLGADGAIEIPVTDSCSGGAQPARFAVRGAFTGFQPGARRVRASDGASESTADVRLYFAGDALLELPTAARSDDPAPVSLTLYGSCLGAGWQLDGAVLRIEADDQCPFEPPPSHVSTVALPVGPLPAGEYDVRVYQRGGIDPQLVRGKLVVRDPERCLPGDTRLCLQGGRFAVTGTWRDFDGNTGVAHAAPLDGSEESGLLWFFAPGNTEMTLKVLDGCGVNGQWWAFLSASSTVESTITVTDLQTHRAKEYRNVLGATPALIADTELEVCP